ncbi:LPXTG cell wall anchor domain-containing protein [Nocardioides pantholopis]|uniref:LPXTG cell wall anchor domain-containing protein n=1 Tax=Nocardioides pantholopis TaxID=2483798 RepID=UPI000FDBBEDA|nr:LPXTG cell wall anchor domain-containing protein [Nocardioides pantholopis]
MRTSTPRGSRSRPRLAGLLAALVGAALLVALPITPAVAAPALGLTTAADATTLVGAASSVTLTARNTGADPAYNLSLRAVLPAGVSFKAGSTSPTEAGAPQVIGQTLIWANVSDLPAGAEQAVQFEALPNAATLRVGATFTVTGQAYVNTNPRTVPRFNTNGTYRDGATQQTPATTATTAITAIKVEKSEPSPEHELLRGVHDHDTTYRLKVTNNHEAASNDAVLVDHLPAQLEFLGCGTVDNTSAGAVEYAGAPRLDASTDDVASCRTPDSVRTVTDPAGLPAGVYTRVEWRLGNLTPDQVVEVVYAAGIPQRANAASFPGVTPSPASLGQSANLDNNTGPSTRETAAEQALTNRAEIAATYQGAVAGGTSAAVRDTDQLTVTAEDLAVDKSVAAGTFVHGGVATYTLRLRAGEYADTTGIVVTNVIANGMCPLGAAGTNYAASAPAECDGTAAGAPSVPFDSVQENADGTFTVVLDPIDIPAGQTRTITYRTKMLTSYRGGSTDPTVVGDGYENRVSLTGTTSTLAAVAPPGGPSDVQVADASEAGIASQSVSLEKRIQPNSASPYTCATNPAAYRNGTELTLPQTTFTEGSRVCFLLRVQFPSGNETKNPVLTDFLPDHLTYEAGTAQPLTGNTVQDVVLDPSTLTFTLGRTTGSNRFVAPGSVFLYRLSGIVAKPSSSQTAADVTGNLAKLRWTNTAGQVGFLRDREDLAVPAPPPVAVTKTAGRVSGTPATLAENATVRGADVVRYTVTLRNNGAAGSRNDIPVVGPDVWDRLPAGVACADVSAIDGGGVCTDPGDAGHPTFSDRAARSAIRWNLADTTGLAAAATLALTYRVTYPGTVGAGRVAHKNDVDVVSYATETNLGTLTQHYPATNADTTVTTAMVDAPRAHDDHTLQTPAFAVTKTNETTVDDATQGANPSGFNYVAVGERVTYTVIGTLPANTTVYGGVLSDPLHTSLEAVGTGYEYRARPSDAWGPLPAGSSTAAATSAPSVTLPAVHDVGPEADAVRMTVTAKVRDVPEVKHGDPIPNTAMLTAKRDGTAGAANTTVVAASSAVTAVEPSPAPLKTVDIPAPRATDVVTFTVTARNLDPAAPTVMRPTLDDAAVVDCVPDGLAVVAGSLVPSTGTASIEPEGARGCGADLTPVVWQVGDLAWQTDASLWPTLTYGAVIDPAAAGGATYTNTATLTGTSMDGAVPGERSSSATADAAVTVPGSGLAKTVTPSAVPVGGTATYTLEATLPAKVNFYDATIVDTLPAGIGPASVELVDSECEFTDTAAGPCAVGATTGSALTVGTTGHGWSLGDVEASSRPRTVTVTYTAVVGTGAANKAGTVLTNSAVLSWNRTDDGRAPAAGAPFDTSTSPGTATVTVTEPKLTVAKTVDQAAPKPGGSFTYTVRLTNATGAHVSAAHDVDVTDRVPAGVVVESASISHGGTLTGGATGGGTITWADLAAVPAAGTRDLTYRARLVSPALSAAQVNTADVSDYRSLAGAGRAYDGPQDTASVTAALPKLVVDKTVLDGPPAYLGEPTRWQVEVTNTGPAMAYDVDVTDTLPTGWSYAAGTATVSVAGGTPASVAPAVTGTGRQTLTWDALGDLATGQSLLVVLAAAPGTALVPSSVGASIAHVNEAGATAQDLDGPAGSVVTTDDDDARSRIDSADLTMDKTVGTAPLAGTTTSWQLSVANTGPDAARGPFTVADVVPAQVTGVSASGTGWSCSVTAPAGAGDPSDLACTRTSATDTLASGAAFPAITVSGTVPAATAAGTTLTNTATVAGRTHDPDETDNADTTTGTVAVRSDLGVAKTLTGALVPGGTATYRIAVANAGPSAARGPIVVVDTLPAGLTYQSVTAPGWDLERTGQRLELTWTGATPVPLGAMAAIDVTVDVASSVTGAGANTATVSEPTDPTSGAESADSSTVSRTVAPSADLALEKTATTAPEAGEQGVYEIEVVNVGPSDAAGPVTVTDTLPPSLTYAGVRSADDWTCRATGQDVTCTLADGLDAAATTTLNLEVDVDEELTGAVENTATVSSPTPDPNPANNTEDDDSTVAVRADLRIEKSLQTSPVVAGQTVSYRLEVRNAGPATSPGPIVVTDALPEGISFVSATGAGWSCSAAADGAEVTCTRAGTLGADTDTAPITVVGRVASGTGTTTLVNHASVDGPAQDPTPANNADTADTPVTERAELAVVKTTTGPDPVRAGTNATFTLTVSNTGPSDARGVTVTDVLPAGLSLVSATGTGWTCVDGTCTRDRIAAGTSAPAVTVVAAVAADTPDGSTLRNVARVSTTTAGDTAAGNEADADVDVVAEADLALTKTHPTEEAIAGEPTSFLLQVANEGPADSVGPTTVTDVLPEGLRYLSASAPWTCAVAPADTQEVTCTLATGLVAGSRAPLLSLQVMVLADADAGPVLNTGTVSSATTDPMPGNDTDAAEVTLAQRADVSVVKTHTGPVQVGKRVAFTLTVANDGPSAARDVVVTDRLPAGLTLVTADGPGWSCADAGALVTCTAGRPLAPAATAAPVTVVAAVTPAAYPVVENIATVATSTYDTDPTDNRSSDTVPVPALVDLAVTKRHDADFVVGEQGRYRLTVTNHGPTPAPGPITLTDALPTSLRYVAATGPGWSCEEKAGTLTCELADALAVGASAGVDLLVDVLPAAYPAVLNSAVVTSGSVDADPANDTDTDVVPVEPTVALALEKAAIEMVGTRVVYELVVTNKGPSATVEPIQVDDPLPPALSLVSATNGPWSCATTERRATCSYADSLAVGETASFQLVTTLAAKPEEKVLNVARVTGGARAVAGRDVVVEASFSVQAPPADPVDEPDDGDEPGNGDDPDQDGAGGRPGEGEADAAGGVLPNTGGPSLLLALLGLALAATGAWVLRRNRGARRRG